MADLIGMRVRDRTTGLVTLEITDRLTRTIGTFETGTSGGSINVPAFSEGLGYACILEAQEPVDNLNNFYRFPRVTISGTTLTWDFPGAGTQSISCQVEYGVY